MGGGRGHVRAGSNTILLKLGTKKKKKRVGTRWEGVYARNHYRDSNGKKKQKGANLEEKQDADQSSKDIPPEDPEGDEGRGGQGKPPPASSFGARLQDDPTWKTFLSLIREMEKGTGNQEQNLGAPEQTNNVL